MNWGSIKATDIANGPGVRVSLFVSGCRNHCPGCFQPETWAFDYGQPFTMETQDHILDLLAPDYIQGLTVLGGEPLEPENQKALLPFLYNVRHHYQHRKDIWLYTGYGIYGSLCGGRLCPWVSGVTVPLLTVPDCIVAGPYIEAEKDLRLPFRGSRNQKIIHNP